MTMAKSGSASSMSLPIWRIAAISASSCSGISVGGRTNNCGAWTVATAATIFPMYAPNHRLKPVLLEFYAQFVELRAETVIIQAQLARAQLFARFLFLGDASLAGLSGLSGGRPWNHHHSILIGDDHVAGVHRRARADNRNVHPARSVLHGSLRVNRLRPNREIHRGQFRNVAHACVDDQPQHSVSDERSRQQFARLADLDRGMDHEVVAGSAEHGDRRSGKFGRGINRAHVGPHQACAALRFMNRSDAQFAENFDGFRIGPRDRADDFGFHYEIRFSGFVTAMRRTSALVKPASSIFCANMAKPSATGGLMVWPRSVERITRSGPTLRTLSK